jgi:hypothetical protein
MVVADAGNDRTQAFGPNRAIAGYSSGKEATVARPAVPRGLAISTGGDLVVADARHHRIVGFASKGGRDSAVGRRRSGTGKFNPLKGAAIALNGTIIIADTADYRIQRLAADGIPVEAWGLLGRTRCIPEPGRRRRC